jgi:hypothetical protein
MTRSLSERIGPWTSYGPRPPGVGVFVGSGWPAGESCLFVNDGSAVRVPRLPVLPSNATATALVRLSDAQLTDGPWCPDALAANRFDADLFRIRRIGVTLRVQTANDALRGPAGALFHVAGRRTAADRRVPDIEVHFAASPRNLNLGR